MKVLVTGGLGYVGSSIVNLLLQDDDVDVVVLDDISSGTSRNMFPGAKNLILDLGLSDLRPVLDYGPYDMVHHLAAYARVPESIENPQRTYRSNVIGSIRLINYLLEYGYMKNLVFSSTSCVQSPCHPYGISKKVVEEMLYSYVHKGLNFLILRYGNVTGSFPNCGGYAQGTITSALVRTLIGEQDEFLLYGTDYDTLDGTCTREYVDVRDIAKLYKYLTFKPSKLNNSVYTVGCGKLTSNLQLISAMERELNRTIPVCGMSRRPGDVQDGSLHGASIWSRVPIKPNTDIQDMMRSVLLWMENNDHYTDTSSRELCRRRNGLS